MSSITISLKASFHQFNLRFSSDSFVYFLTTSWCQFISFIFFKYGVIYLCFFFIPPLFFFSFLLFADSFFLIRYIVLFFPFIFAFYFYFCQFLLFWYAFFSPKYHFLSCDSKTWYSINMIVLLYLYVIQTDINLPYSFDSIHPLFTCYYTSHVYFYFENFYISSFSQFF